MTPGVGELSPDMIWFSCQDCGRNFTLADMYDDNCPHCGESGFKHYTG